MDLFLLLVITLVTGGSLVALLQRWNRHRTAATVFLLYFPLVGALSVLPGFLLYGVWGALLPSNTPGRWGEVLFIWTVNAPVEELAKYLSFVLAATLFRSLKEPQDGSLQGAATGLGFGLVENFLYGLSGGWQLLLLRSVVSLPGHMIYGAVWGGYHGFEVYQGRGKLLRWWVPALALVPAAFAHALFNTLVLFDTPVLLALCGDGLTLGFGLFLFFRLRALSPHRLRRPLKEWKLAIPETEHALALDPDSPVLRRRLAAYLLAARQSEKALAVLEGLSEHPWTQFYRDAARRQNSPGGPLPPSSELDAKLFVRLTGG